MNQLLKLYSLESEMDYFDMIAMSYINGQKKQAIAEFKAMPIPQQKNFVYLALTGCYSSFSNVDGLFFLNLL